MIRAGDIEIHFIEEGGSKVFSRQLCSVAPSAGDEVRFGGEGNEQFFTIKRLVWVYDEPENPYHRVNVGMVKI